MAKRTPEAPGKKEDVGGGRCYWRVWVGRGVVGVFQTQRILCLEKNAGAGGAVGGPLDWALPPFSVGGGGGLLSIGAGLVLPPGSPWGGLVIIYTGGAVQGSGVEVLSGVCVLRRGLWGEALKWVGLGERS